MKFQKKKKNILKKDKNQENIGPHFLQSKYLLPNNNNSIVSKNPPIPRILKAFIL